MCRVILALPHVEADIMLTLCTFDLNVVPITST